MMMKRFISRLLGACSALLLSVFAHAAAPVLVDYVESNWTDESGSETAAPISWEAGDVIYVIAAIEQGGDSFNTPTVTGLSFSSVANIGTDGSNARVQVWEATAGSSGSGSITANKVDMQSLQAGLAVYQFRGVDSRSSVASTLGGNNKVISLTVEKDDAHVIVALMDWNAVDDTSVSPTPSGGTQRRANYSTGAYTAFVFDWAEQASGTRNYGITDHTGTVKTAGIAFAVYGEEDEEPPEPDIVATKLIFGSQPGNIVVGQTFGAFTVRAVDDTSALDESFDGNVTLSLQTGSGTLDGTTTKAAVDGIATFDDISISTLNTGAVIRATADGLAAADSDPFNVTAGGSGGTAGVPSTSHLGGMLQ